ncbi:tannase and feruloyl esterase [Mycena maculata]|uniref:Carboxylic ester hydrolase n=1 Tax=Mycena maculata TaxID=230809 RepID=A0AAD7K3N7_9AGAR|nr:tannase and feruloyl esterase [Mycena maculata]
MSLLSGWNYGGNYGKCLALKKTLNLENTTILDVAYVAAGATVKTQGTCVPTAHVSAPLCRVQFSVQTSTTSEVRAEAWLPDEWHGRFLGLGNGGLGGCIGYQELDYGSAMHFATVGTNNGHDGYGGHVFLGHAEIVETYYGRTHAKAYYLGCSTGGRQGTQTALKYPADFDGILAGAPATDFNHLAHWTGMMARAIGAPAGTSSPAFIPPELWKLVAAEVLAQCDGLDGVKDGIVTEPDACVFRPEALLCHGQGSGTCLTLAQVEALRTIYAPLYGDGELLYPRLDPGAEGVYIGGPGSTFSGEFPSTVKDWLRYAVLNVTEYDFSQYGAEEGRAMEEVNPGGIATFDGDLTAFRDRGGKFLTYHGRMDPVIPSGNSKRVYDLVARTLGAPALDAFYRLVLVPGMAHCAGGPGAAAFGQIGGTNARNASSHNALLALVDWVEGGAGPETITGTADDGTERVHCRYPMRSVWDGARFGCEN